MSGLSAPRFSLLLFFRPHLCGTLCKTFGEHSYFLSASTPHIRPRHGCLWSEFNRCPLGFFLVSGKQRRDGSVILKPRVLRGLLGSPASLKNASQQTDETNLQSMESAILLTLSSRKRPAEYSAMRLAYLLVNQSVSSGFLDYDSLFFDLGRTQMTNRL